MDEYKGIYFNETNELKFYEGGAHFRYIDLVNVLEDIKAKNVFKQRNAKSMTVVRNKNNNEGISSNCKMKYQSRNIHPLIQSLTQKLSEITNKQKQEEIHINKKAIGNNNNNNNHNKLLIVHQRQTSKIDNVNSSTSCVSNNNDIKHKASRNQIKNGNAINSINTCNTALTLGKNTINKQMWKKTICSNTNNNNNNSNNHPIVNKIKVNYSISESQYNFQKKSTTMIINNERSRNKQLQQHQHQPSHQIIHPNNHPKTSLLHLTKTNPTHKDVFIQNLSFIKPTSTVIHKKHTPDKRRNKSIGDITVNRDKAYLNQNNSCNSNNTNNIKMDNSTITNSHHHNQRTFSMHNEISLLSSDLNTSNRGSTTVVINNNNNNNDKHFPFNINQINTVNNNNNNIIVKPRINISFVNNINTKSRNKTANKNHSNGKTINVNRDATRLHNGGGNSVSNKYNTLFKTNNSLKGICSVNGNNNNNKAVSPLGKGKKRVVSGVKMNYHGKSNSGYSGNNVNMNMNMNRNGSDVGKVSIEFEILAKGMKSNYAKLSEITLKRKKKDL